MRDERVGTRDFTHSVLLGQLYGEGRCVARPLKGLPRARGNGISQLGRAPRWRTSALRLDNPRSTSQPRQEHASAEHGAKCRGASPFPASMSGEQIAARASEADIDSHANLIREDEELRVLDCLTSRSTWTIPLSSRSWSSAASRAGFSRRAGSTC